MPPTYSPVAIYIGDPITFVAKYLYGHPNAAKLRKKNLIEEFNIYRKRANALTEHTKAIKRFICALLPYFPSVPFPERPNWPEREHPGKDANPEPEKASPKIN